MQNLHDFITELEAYCRAAGQTPATVCGNATGNRRLPERLKRKAAKIDEDVGKLKAYMAKHPARPSSEASQ